MTALLLPAAAAAVAAAVASFQMVGGKCLIPWRAPPCVGRGRRIYILLLFYYIIFCLFYFTLYYIILYYIIYINKHTHDILNGVNYRVIDPQPLESRNCRRPELDCSGSFHVESWVLQLRKLLVSHIFGLGFSICFYPWPFLGSMIIAIAKESAVEFQAIKPKRHGFQSCLERWLILMSCG